LLVAGTPYLRFQDDDSIPLPDKGTPPEALLTRLAALHTPTATHGHMVEGIRADGRPILVGSATVTTLAKPKGLADLAKALRENMKHKSEDDITDQKGSP
ncbi:MAG: hypothetical protein ACLFTK_17135, partial [Anaerolineales bacterium]